MDADVPMFESSRLGTSAGGSGGGALRRLSSTHFPRSTGDVRVAYDETESTPGQIDLPELGTCDVRYSVVTSQPLVEERVASVDEVEDAAVVPDDRIEEELGLAPHRQAQVILELRELVAVARQRLEGAELQPLAAEILGQRVRLRATCASPGRQGSAGRVACRYRLRAGARRRACSPTGNTISASRARER